MLIWITESVEAVDGVATISQSNVKEGTHDIKISGDALEDTSRVVNCLPTSGEASCFTG